VWDVGDGKRCEGEKGGEDGADVEIDGLEATESAFDRSKTLVRSDDVIWGQPVVADGRADDIDAIERRFLGNALGVALVAEPIVSDLKPEVLGHVVAAHHAPHGQT
jgi:hypothetical protein